MNITIKSYGTNNHQLINRDNTTSAKNPKTGYKRKTTAWTLTQQWKNSQRELSSIKINNPKANIYLIKTENTSNTQSYELTHSMLREVVSF